MWLKRLLGALHGYYGVGNGAGIDLEAQVARWPPASGGPSLLRYALTGPRGACAEQVQRVPKALVWTLLGVVSMQPVQQHCLARAERASIAWSSAEISHFALTFMHAVAVPVLVEVVKLMTPAQPQGRKAYQSLLELGFVDTEFKGAAPASN